VSLQARIADVLARLSTLSEAAGARPPQQSPPSQAEGARERLDPEEKMRMGTAAGSSHSGESAIPAGVRLDLDPNRPPPKERSLYDWYRWMFDHVDPDDVDRLNSLLFLAERDYNSRSRQGPTVSMLSERRVAVRAGAHLDQDDSAGSADAPAWPAPLANQRQGSDDDTPARPNLGEAAEREAARQVVDLYEGVRAEEAAVIENVPIQVIHKARKQHKRNTDDGRPRPPFLDWDDAERRRQIGLLQQQAKFRGEVLGAKALGQHFGVAKNTVRPYLEPVAAAA
jgi:hypothetical protein